MPARESTIKPDHRAIKTYYDQMSGYADMGITKETSVRTATIQMFTDTAKTYGWILITEQGKRVAGRTIFPDATFYLNGVPRGYWEAKDTADNLDQEIRNKIARGYPTGNIIFEDTRTAVLYQHNAEQYRADMSNPVELARLLNDFFRYVEPVLEKYDEALEDFTGRVPELSTGLKRIIEEAHKKNKKFQSAFNDFYELCKTALNPNISLAAVDEMLVQHLLTERLIRKIFDNPEFTRRNVIAAEIEKVIAALVSQSFNRDDYLRSLDSFFTAIESAAHGLDFKDKQTLLNEVYERFFQGYSTKIADTHGIVYTPQPIVDFMCASVVEVLQNEFGKTLGDPDVVILDPATGTGNFIVNLLRRAPKQHLESLYKNRLFANEIMLLPYYIASLNIEHAYYELAGTYESFEGICFVDTLDLAESAQMRMSFMTEENTARVQRQKQAPITVIIGNPPYNVGQVNENDNNKNRKYEVIDGRIADTYAKDSQASSVAKIYDPYVKFFRWATDRLQGRDGVVCYVSNNSFVDQLAFDGMRKHLLDGFTHIYHIDLHGNVRQNPKLSGTTHNVFGIQVGVGITVAVKSAKHKDRRLYYERVPELWRKEEKLQWLGRIEGIVPTLTPSPSPSERGEGRKISKDMEKFRERASEVMVQVARELRQSITDAEAFLWEHLRNRRLAGIKFRRQHPLANMNYVADFYCYENKLVIELDGAIHDGSEQQAVDRVRQGTIEEAGNYVLRFKNEQIFSDLKSVLAEIMAVHETLIPNPSPSERRESKKTTNPSSDSPRPEGEGLGVRVNWKLLTPDAQNTWLTINHADEFARFLPLAQRERKGEFHVETIFRLWSAGIATHRDDVVYDFTYDVLSQRMSRLVEDYNAEVDRFKRAKNAPKIDEFVNYDKVKWDEALKQHLQRFQYAEYLPNRIATALYRPFSKRYLYVDRLFISRVYRMPNLIFSPASERENKLIWLKTGSDWSMFALMSNHMVDLLPQGGSQCFSFYTYDDMGGHRDENITNWALTQFRDHYADPTISKWDIFYYVYGVLHHPDYRTKFADNLKRELPRIPFAPDFRSFAEAGKKLADLHLNYETVTPYPLKWIETPNTPISYHVEKMKLNKDKTAVQINHTLTLSGIPPEAFNYRLGNRSALDWIIDQYQVSTDKRSGITSDPNGYSSDSRYIVDLVCRIVTVSLETVKIVNALPAHYTDTDGDSN